jgi:hypothetical protein
MAPPPFLTIDYRWKNSTLRLFSMITTFGTAQSMTSEVMDSIPIAPNTQRGGKTDGFT